MTMPQDFTPLPPAALHIVLALNRGPRHGYGIMQDVEELSGGVIRMGPGTLYGTVKKLVTQGLIEEIESPSPDDERRKYYRLTGLGEEVSAAEIERLATLVVRTGGGAARRLLGELAP